MDPSPVTPSPRRFVLKSGTSRPPPSQAQTPLPSAQQFKSTPRFSLSQAPKPAPVVTQDEAPSPLGARLASAAFPSKRLQENIEDDNPTDTEVVHDSIETANLEEAPEHSGDEDEDPYAIDTRSPKRRRLLTPSIEDNTLLETHNYSESPAPSSSVPILSSPTAPATQKPSATPRFILPTHAPLSTPHPTKTLLAPTQDLSADTPPFIKPPRFRPPDPDVAANTDPLPDAFSPHRRGQKYIPGGLASEVRDWLVNLEGSTSVRERKGEWALKIVVDEVKGGSGMILVRGRQVHEDGTADPSDSVKVVLAGEGMMEGLRRSVVNVGGVVGIKGPLWDVCIKGERWGVGVEWKAL